MSLDDWPIAVSILIAREWEPLQAHVCCVPFLTATPRSGTAGNRCALWPRRQGEQGSLARQTCSLPAAITLFFAINSPSFHAAYHRTLPTCLRDIDC